MKLIEEHKHHDCSHGCAEHKEEQNKHLHGVVCSLSCNHEEHERTGFAGNSYTNFTEESIFDQLEDKIKKYIDQQATLFEAPVF